MNAEVVYEEMLAGKSDLGRRYISPNSQLTAVIEWLAMATKRTEGR